MRVNQLAAYKPCPGDVYVVRRPEVHEIKTLSGRCRVVASGAGDGRRRYLQGRDLRVIVPLEYKRDEGSVMAVFRFLAWILVASAVALLGADGVSSLERGEPVMRPTAEILGLIGIDGIAIAENAPGGVSQALGAVMDLPLWAVVGVIGVVLTLVFRPID